MHTMSKLKDRAFVLDSKKVQDFLSQKVNTSTDALKRASEKTVVSSTKFRFHVMNNLLGT